MANGKKWEIQVVDNFTNTDLIYLQLIEEPIDRDADTVDLVDGKKDSVFIWCNADKFVNFFDLKGFYSGMFISEVEEAVYCGLPGTSQEIVDESNYGFCEMISKYIKDGSHDIHKNIKNEYGILAENNPVALYNHKRLFVN